MDFPCALLLIMRGFVVKREGWGGEVSLWVPKVGEECNIPFLHITYGDNNLPWTPNQLDILAIDWEIVED